MAKKSPEQQLAVFIAKYEVNIQGLARDVLVRMRERLPGAVQLVYDNYNALVVVFGPTERASDAIFSIALYPRWVNLFFAHGANLPDAKKILQGSGNQVRSVRLKSAEDLDAAPVRALMQIALQRAGCSLDDATQARLVIKSISAKQRSRRPDAGRERRDRKGTSD